MNKNRTFQNAMSYAPLAMICCVLLSGSFARAESDDNRCSSRTLKGEYGFRIDGTLLNGPRTGLLRGLAVTHFDGQGNLTQVDFTTINGSPTAEDWRLAKGTYTINGNCTGVAQIIPADGSPAINLRLVVVRNGKEVHTLVVGNPTGSVGIRVD